MRSLTVPSCPSDQLAVKKLLKYPYIVTDLPALEKDRVDCLHQEGEVSNNCNN